MINLEKLNNFEEMLEEAFHTYQLYLECTNILNDQQTKLPLLKWPDVAQSALKYALVLEKENSSKNDVHIAKQILHNDLQIVIVNPILTIYESTQERIKKLFDKSPVETPNIDDDPIKYKNNIIASINKIFNALETMTGVKYGKLNKRGENGSHS